MPGTTRSWPVLAIEADIGEIGEDMLSQEKKTEKKNLPKEGLYYFSLSQFTKFCQYKVFS
jgi:hypothetical protein